MGGILFLLLMICGVSVGKFGVCWCLLGCCLGWCLVGCLVLFCCWCLCCNCWWLGRVSRVWFCVLIVRLWLWWYGWRVFWCCVLLFGVWCSREMDDGWVSCCVGVFVRRERCCCWVWFWFVFCRGVGSGWRMVRVGVWLLNCRSVMVGNKRGNF